VHNGAAVQLADEEMAVHLKQRISGITVPEMLFTADGEVPNPAYAEKVEYETERAQEGWNASCECGWRGNNPLPTEDDAHEAIEEHYEAVRRSG